MDNSSEGKKMDNIVNLAKRRGFVYPSSEIYGGFAGVYDYGPLGVLLENKIRSHWWKWMVQKRLDIVGLDSGIFMNPKIWKASGHVDKFSDPLIECKGCHTRSRADHLLEEIGVTADEKMSSDEINKIFDEQRSKVNCPKCGAKNFASVELFNLLVESNLGQFTGGGEKSYLRGETCQGIYVNFKNVLDTTNIKIPFGIAQTGKAFRNEITPRQFIFRTREFEQMEMQYFIEPDNEMTSYEELREYRWRALTDIGLKEENLRWKKHDNLVFYAKEAYDIEYKYHFGWKELEGIHARGSYDLTQHTKFSGVNLEYYDDINNKRYIPHIIESSIGLGRLFLAVLTDAYNEEEVNGEKRIVLKLSKKIAPYEVAILPLSKKDELVDPSRALFEKLSDKFMCQYDDTQSIGKRYRRQDEIGTPYCITVDFESTNDGMVTIRERDTMNQERISIDTISEYLRNELDK